MDVECYRKYYFNLKFNESVDQWCPQNAAVKESWEMGQELKKMKAQDG